MKKLVILGGGTSGWFTASILNKFWKDKYQIILIADEKLGNIGVGEATVPNIKDFLKIIDVSEDDLFKHCDATIKTGIKFINWNENRNFYHPFYSEVDEKDNIFYWKKLIDKGIINLDFDKFSSYIPYLSDKNRIVNNLSSHKEYAYHFDTLKLGNFLKNKCINEGIKYINSKVIDFKQGDNGFIQEILLESGELIDLDLIFDCSGFSSVILGSIYKEPYIPFGNELLCNNTIVRRFKYDESFKDRVPYTTSIAMNHGWMWKIPLKNNLSVGYVHSNMHANPEEIQKEIMQYIDLEPINDFREVNIKTGHYKRAFVNNVIAVGLSYGFIEPLESTGLQFIYTMLIKLIETFSKFENNTDLVRDEFNTFSYNSLENIKHFIVFHYILNEKNTKFWLDAKKINNIDNFIFNNFSDYCKKGIIFDGPEKSFYFGNRSYSYILAGMKSIKYLSEKLGDNSINISDIDLNNFNTYINSYINKNISDSQNYNDFLNNYV